MTVQFLPLDAVGTTDAVIHRIATAISQGLLRPGDKLPSERDLATQFAVSRQSVRLAIKSLAESGVVSIVSGQGAGSGAHVLSNYVPLELLGGHRPVPNFSEVASVLEARRLFEPGVAVLAGYKMNDDDYEAMREVIELQKGAKDLQGIRSLDIRFHLAIAGSTHNRTVMSLMRTLMQQLDIARHVVTLDSDTEARETIEIHERTLEAIASRDKERIELVMDAHLRMMETAWEQVSSRALPSYTRDLPFGAHPHRD